MKLINSVLVVILLWLFAASVVFSQNRAADEALNRDIRIAEGILHELFFDDDPGPMPAVRFQQIRSRGVSGEYIPGYGVHFSISPILNVFNSEHLQGIRIYNTDNRPQIQIHVNEDEAKKTEENGLAQIEDSMLNYFKTYAQLLVGMDDSEVIRISYGYRSDGAVYQMFDSQGGRHSASFSMWVPVSEVKKYHRDQITESEFEEKIHRYDFSDKIVATDLNIFASVLETVINSVDTEHLELRRKPAVDYLPGLGAQYSIQITPKRPGFFFGDFNGSNIRFELDSLNSVANFNVGDLNFQAPRVNFSSDSLRVYYFSDEFRDSIRKYTREAQKYAEQAREYAREARLRSDSLRNVFASSFRFNGLNEEDEEELKTEIDKITNQVIDILPDYGPTLSTLQDDELLMITIDWGRVLNHVSDILPQKTEIRISKADLLRGRNPEITEVERR